MGFTIQTYQLYGLPSLPNIYVTIKGSFTVKKTVSPAPVPYPGNYNISFTIYFQASLNDPIITQKDSSFYVQSLPSPADLYTLIYDYVKKTLDPFYGTSQQVLTYTDD